MEYIYDWIRIILVFKVLSSILIEMANGEKNRKLIRFFAGIIFIALVTQPIIAIIEYEDYWPDFFEKSDAMGELQDLSILMNEGDLKRKQAIYREYEEMIGGNIAEIVNTQDLVLDHVDVEFDSSKEDSLEIKYIKIYVSRKYKPDQAVKRAYDEKKGNVASMEEIQIKKEVSKFYKIKEDNIFYEEW